MAVNFQSVTDSGILGDINLTTLIQDAKGEVGELNCNGVEGYDLEKTDHCFVCKPWEPMVCTVYSQCCWDQEPYC